MEWLIVYASMCGIAFAVSFVVTFATTMVLMDKVNWFMPEQLKPPFVPTIWTEAKKTFSESPLKYYKKERLK